MRVGLLSWGGSGCYDLRQVGVDPADQPRPPPLLIDDFEDGDTRPSVDTIEPWRCATYGPGPGVQPVACGPAAGGNGSDRGYSLWFDLWDTPDGYETYPMARLFAPFAMPMDVSPYQELRFSVRYDEGDIPLPMAAFLQVSLHCDEMSSELPSLDNAVAPSTNWVRVVLPVANFTQPEWQTEKIDPADCAAQIDQLSFEIKGFSDGETGSGTLSLDDIYLR
jgi:hypothetical protein